jgi:hypothetical protein
VGVGCDVEVAGVPRVVAGGIGGKGAGWAIAVGVGVGAHAGVDVCVVGLLCAAVAAVLVGIVGVGVIAGVGARWRHGAAGRDRWSVGGGCGGGRRWNRGLGRSPSAGPLCAGGGAAVVGDGCLLWDRLTALAAWGDLR